VGTVEDGRALVEAAQKLRPDLILLDISMPPLRARTPQLPGSFRSRPAIKKRILQTFS
jgi:CheY-like chemotaxis protein